MQYHSRYCHSLLHFSLLFFCSVTIFNILLHPVYILCMLVSAQCVGVWSVHYLCLSDPPSLQLSKCQNAYSTLKALSVLCDRVCILALRRPCTGGFNTHPVLSTLLLCCFDICPGIWFTLRLLLTAECVWSLILNVLSYFQVAIKRVNDGQSHLTCHPSPPVSLSSWRSCGSDCQRSPALSVPQWIYITPKSRAVTQAAHHARMSSFSWGALARHPTAPHPPGRFLTWPLC